MLALADSQAAACMPHMRQTLQMNPVPNHRAALDAAVAVCLRIARQWRGASERER